MKNLKHFSRRGLASLLALVMCLGMLQIPAFADESLVCGKEAHTHTAACYELVCGLEETPEVKDETKDEVQDETKDEVQDETKDEVQDETKDEVQDEVQDETKDEVQDEVQDETKDKVKDETKDKVKDETKDKVKDETKDKVKDKVKDETPEVKDEASAGTGSNSDSAPATADTPADTESTSDSAPVPEESGSAGGHKHGPECYKLICGKEGHRHSASCYEQVPAEVKAFLDAVKKIPAITPENAVEASEYIYGPLSDAYAELLGTDFMDRADVKAAEARYEAAIKAVDAALDMESSELAYNYVNTYDVTLFVGQTVHHVFRPPNTRGFLGNNYTGEVFYLENANNTANCLSVGQVQYRSSVYTYDANGNYESTQEKVGVATLKGKAPGTCSAGYWYYYRDAYGYTRTGYQGYNITVLPTTVTNDYDLELEVGASEDVELEYLVNNMALKNLTATSVSQNSEVAKVTTPSVTSTTLTNSIEGVSAGSTTVTYRGQGNYQVYSKLGTYNNIGITYVDNVNVTVKDAKTYTVTYTDGVEGKTVFADQSYEGLHEGDDTPAFEPEDPTSYTDDAGNTYTFQGWNPTVNPVVSADDADDDGNIVYTATWQKNDTLKDLTVTKTASNKTPTVGEEFKYTITVHNPNSKAIVVKITDVLNEKLDVVWDEEYEMYGVSDGGSYNKATRTVTWNNVEVPANGDKTVTVTVKANAPGTIENTANITWDGGNNSGDETVTAKDPEYTYTLTYHANGGNENTLPTPNPETVADTTATSHEFTVSSTVPTRDGYEFQGWNTQADGTGTAYKAGDKITATTTDKDLHLYAQWKEKVTLSYDANGGKDAPTSETKVTGSEFTVKGQESMTNGDKVFQGWNTRADGSGTSHDPDAKLTLTEDTTLYAQWEDKDNEYQLIYHENGENVTSMPGNESATDKAASHNFTVSSDAPTREGYVFKGWNDQANGTGTTYAAGATITATKADPTCHLYAQWSKLYTVSYEWTTLPEGLTAGDLTALLPESKGYEVGATVTVDGLAAGREIEVGGKTYVFSGWDRTGTFEMPANNVVIRGTWTEKTYNVTYSWSGLPEGHNETLPTGGRYAEGAQVTVDGRYTNGSTATVNGDTYVFSGWSQTGTFEMPDHNVVISGSWSYRRPTPDPRPTPNPDPDPTPNPDPTNPTNPTNPTDPTVDVPDPDVPLTDLPDEDVPLANIPEEEVPLAETPEEIEIPEEDVPLANVPRTGDISALWYLTTLLSAGILAFLGLRRRDRH